MAVAIDFTAVSGFDNLALALKIFNQLRLKLSNEVAGAGGAGAGYDHLEVESAVLAELRPQTRLHAAAELISCRIDRHLVRYRLTFEPTDTPQTLTEIVVAQGWTLTGDQPPM